MPRDMIEQCLGQQRSRGGPHRIERKLEAMPQGTIKKLTTKGFGFIDTGGKGDLFFHSSSVQGATFDELHEGQKVEYTEGRGPKGPNAENVRVIG